MPTKTLPSKPSHALLADIFAAAPMIRDVARSEHQAAQENHKTGSFYSPEEQFAGGMRDFAHQLMNLSETFERFLKLHGKEVQK